MLKFRPYEVADEKNVFRVVTELKKYYPEIESWLRGTKDKPGQLDKISKGEVQCILAEIDGEIAGVVIHGEEKGMFSTTKLKTFYVTEKYRGLAIGPYLLNRVIDYCVEKRRSKIYVTFAEEEVSLLLEYFKEFGFQLDGVFPLNYRANASEYYMSKLQIYGAISIKEFKEFVKNYLFRLRGYALVQDEGDYLVYRKLISFKESYKLLVRIITDKNKNAQKIAEESSIVAARLKCKSIIIASYYAFELKGTENIKVVDGFDIQTMFYPIVLRKNGPVGFVSTINPVYAQRILFNGSQALLDPDKKSLRRDKVFYKYPNISGGFERGDVFVFYESEPTKSIVGEGLIKEIVKDTPERLIERFDSKGLLTEEEINSYKNPSGVVLAIVIGKFMLYKKKVSLEEIKSSVIKNYNPQGPCPITQPQLDQIRKLGGSY